MKSNENTGELTMVATPIGNMLDLSLRARDVLAKADTVVCENPDYSRRLFSAHGIDVGKLRKLTEHTAVSVLDELLNDCLNGQHLAYISDAGTPCISDPGSALVHRAHTLRVKVSTVPGACAAVAALSMSGYSAVPFVFHGFVAQKKKTRDAQLQIVRDSKGAHVFYESPHRLLASIEIMLDFFGKQHEVFILKEISKVYECYWKMSLGELQAYFENTQIKGEYVLVLYSNGSLVTQEIIDIRKAFEAMVKRGLSAKECCEVLSECTNVSKNTLYALFNK